MLANIYQVRCKRCKRVATVAARIKPVTVTFTPLQAQYALRAIFMSAAHHWFNKRPTVAGRALVALETAIQQQTKPRRKVV
jgi:hypothetical protein